MKGEKSKNLSGIEQVSALCLQDTDVLVWECSTLQGFVFLFSFQLIILLNPPTEKSQAERKLMESKAWSGDRIEQPMSGLWRIFSCYWLVDSFTEAFQTHLIFFFNSISMFVTVSPNSNEGDVFSALRRRILVHKLKAIIKIIKNGLCWEIEWLMSKTSLLSG